ncbi:hypothetical protein GCM10025857_26560 [Alicyclobacillus contaminans]|uniref:flagellar biosynthesis anti-sigma factor FlgM n=1 Tax=Alicyclobacillus contaminans TaxID=392016 RepID=UPI000406242B|nr:flagellar biosynthesis anti-sigma factor FlgM [Alicyclobacillus contaminans]GMA51299.1 hypothetical protein GCM10025857_26560 [Alicyclobacillus contaminans]
MRIDDSKIGGYSHSLEFTLRRVATPATSAQNTAAAADSERTESQNGTRADRIERLKQAFASGQPIDVQKLADKLLDSGVPLHAIEGEQ